MTKRAAAARARPAARASATLALALAFAGCKTPIDARSAATAPVRTQMSADPASLTLIGKTDANSDLIASLLSDSLVKYDASLSLQPRLAESWDVSPDGLVYTFHLREGVRWHDGAPFTADDVVFTVNKVKDPATQSRSWISAFDEVVALEAPDAQTVRVVYRNPYADALDSWTMPIVPAHLVSKDPDFLTGEYSRHPIGCGPYRLVRWELGQELVLEANPDYWDGAPVNGGITFRVIPNERTAYEALLRGDLDVLPAVTPDLWLESRKSEAAARMSRILSWRLAVYVIGWNQDGSNPFFTDARVRRAMILALDRDRFAAQALHGLARPAVTTYHPDSQWTDATLRPWSFDPAESRRLLAEAGYRDADGDGVVERSGTPFRFTLLIPVSSQELVDRTAAWIQDSLSKIGVGVAIEKLEWRAFQERRAEHRFQAAMASVSLSPIPDQFELYHTTSRASGRNYIGLHDDEVDRLLIEGRRTFDRDARRMVYAALQARLHEIEPLSCLFHFAVPVLYDPRLDAVATGPLGLWVGVPGPRIWRWTARGKPG